MYCTYCASDISEHAEICPNCGVRKFTVHNYCHSCGSETRSVQDMCTSCGIILKAPKGLHPLVPTLLTCICPGVGQIINNQLGKGILCIILFVISIFIPYMVGIFTVGILLLIDAYLIGKKQYEGKVVGKWEIF